MVEGLLWFDSNPKRDLANKVQRAADRYREKFGCRPNLCYVHESAVDGVCRFNGIKVVPAHNTLKYHFWIGVDGELLEPEPAEEEAAEPVEDADPVPSFHRVCPNDDCRAEQITVRPTCWQCGRDLRIKEA